MSDLDFFARAFIKIISVINPLCLVPPFIALTQSQSCAQRKIVARRGIGIASCLLGVVVFAGDSLFQTMGISFYSFKIAGGVLLFLSGLGMVMGSSGGSDDAEARDIAVFPLAMPLIAGPGSMTAGIVLMNAAQGDSFKVAQLCAALVAVLSLNWICLHQAEWIVRLLGQTGLNIASRIFGVVIATIAVDLIVSGVQASFHLCGM